MAIGGAASVGVTSKRDMRRAKAIRTSYLSK
ncbi:hypothetical protein SY94_6097 (plasmid) [Agrobacterium tumefaciens]|nr:hypothetical protein SY94_6097 [Agrobacterium tumefaciens]